MGYSKIKRFIIIITFGLICVGVNGQKKVALVDFTPSQCDESIDPYRLQTRIVDQWFDGDMLKIEVGTVATCCVDFEPSIKFENGTLYLDFNETGTVCSCKCCYQFVYHINGLKDKVFKVRLRGQPVKQSSEKYRTYPVKYDIYENDTINRVDKYGLKQGYWFTKLENGGHRKAYAKDDEFTYTEYVRFNDSLKMDHLTIWKNKSSVSHAFYPNGNIRFTISENPGFREKKLFYEDGTLEKIELLSNGNFDLWKEFYPNGKLRKERFFNDDPLWSIHYYDTGELMAKYYIFKESFSTSTRRWDCFDKSGREISKEDLIEKRFLDE